MYDRVKNLDSVAGIFKTGFEIFRGNVKDFTLLVLIFILPIPILSALGAFILSFIPSVWMLLIIAVLMTFFSVVISIYMTICIIAYTGGTILGEKPTYLSVIKNSRPLLERGVGTIFLLGLCIFALFLLFVFPALIFGVFWIFVPAIVVFEKKYSMEAFSLSKKMVEGRWFKTVGYIFVIGIFLIIVNIVARSIFLGFTSIIYSLMNGPGVNLILNSIDIVLGQLLAILGTVITTVWYFSWRHNTASKSVAVSPTPQQPVTPPTPQPEEAEVKTAEQVSPQAPAEPPAETPAS